MLVSLPRSLSWPNLAVLCFLAITTLFIPGKPAIQCFTKTEDCSRLCAGKCGNLLKAVTIPSYIECDPVEQTQGFSIAKVSKSVKASMELTGTPSVEQVKCITAGALSPGGDRIKIKFKDATAKVEGTLESRQGGRTHNPPMFKCDQEAKLQFSLVIPIKATAPIRLEDLDVAFPKETNCALPYGFRVWRDQVTDSEWKKALSMCSGKLRELFQKAVEATVANSELVDKRDAKLILSD